MLIDININIIIIAARFKITQQMLGTKYAWKPVITHFFISIQYARPFAIYW